MPVLIETIDWLLNREDTIFMTGSQITDWFIAESTKGGEGLQFSASDRKA